MGGEIVFTVMEVAIFSKGTDKKLERIFYYEYRNKKL